VEQPLSHRFIMCLIRPRYMRGCPATWSAPGQLRLPQRAERRVSPASAVPRIADQVDVQGMVVGLVPRADIPAHRMRRSPRAVCPCRAIRYDQVRRRGLGSWENEDCPGTADMEPTRNPEQSVPSSQDVQSLNAFLNAASRSSFSMSPRIPSGS